MIELKDLQIIIPIRVDSKQRLRNYLMVLKHIRDNFFCNNTNLTIIYPIINFEDKNSPESGIASYIPYIDSSGYFNKSKLVNEAFKRTNKNIILVLDADVIVQPFQLLTAYKLIEQGVADFVVPYNKTVLDVFKASSKRLIKEGFEKINKLDYKLLGTNLAGGAVMFNRKSFKEIGMMNEKFIGLEGCETELIVRAEKLGAKVHETVGYLIHLTHDRITKNATYKNTYKEALRVTIDNLNRKSTIYKMTPTEIRKEMESWEWLK